MHAQCCCFANLNLLLFCRSRCRSRRRCLSSLMTLVILPLDVIYSVMLLTLKRLRNGFYSHAELFTYRTQCINYNSLFCKQFDMDVIYSVMLLILKRLSWKRLYCIVLYCIVCHVNWKSQKDCTRFQIKSSGQPMRRVGGSGGRFGSCQVESIVYTIKLYPATLTVYPRPLPHYPPLSHWKMNIKCCCPHLCCSSFVWGLCFIVDFVFSLFPNQSWEQLQYMHLSHSFFIHQ